MNGVGPDILIISDDMGRLNNPNNLADLSKYLGDLDTEKYFMNVFNAAKTDGNFYRATNKGELKKIYQDIDKLEKTKLDVKTFSKRYEAYQPFAIAAIAALLLEILLRITVFRRIP